MAEGKADLLGGMFGVSAGGSAANDGYVMPHDEAAFANMTV